MGTSVANAHPNGMKAQPGMADGKKMTLLHKAGFLSINGTKAESHAALWKGHFATRGIWGNFLEW